jgi:glycosyltransferase involved in cell wall biosynthesis
VAGALAARGHQVTILCVSDGPAATDGHRLYAVAHLPRRLWRPWRWVRTAVAIIRAGRNADVLLTYGLALEAVVANRILRRPLALKVVGDLAWERAVLSERTSDTFETFQQRRHGARVELLRWLRAWWTRQASAVVVHSQYMARWVSLWGVPAERLHVIYNAVEPLHGITPIRPPLGTPVVVVVAARLVPWKQVDRVIEAVAGLPGVGLVIVGDGPERPRLEQQARETGVAARVDFAGQRPRVEALGLIAGGDIFVLYSRWEGFPHVVLEAMMLGLPVVATAVGGTPEMLRDGESGRLISPDDDAGLRRALAGLVASPEERARLAAGAKRAAARFAPGRMIDEVEAVLRAAAPASGSGPR